MNYGYGIWLTFEEDIFKTNHIPHITVACKMLEKDARELYNVLKNDYTKIEVQILPDAVLDDTWDVYLNDSSEVKAWGYNVVVKQWDEIEKICSKFNCSFSYSPHISIEYYTKDEKVDIKNFEYTKTTCTLRMANITSNDEKKWIFM